jgi:hypothetical protein
VDISPVARRRAGRVLVIDPDGRVLLLQGFDPAVPQRRFWFTIGGGRQDEEYFLLRTGVVEVTLDGLEEAEQQTVTAHRWWGADELVASGEPFVPPELPALLRELADR